MIDQNLRFVVISFNCIDQENRQSILFWIRNLISMLPTLLSFRKVVSVLSLDLLKTFFICIHRINPILSDCLWETRNKLDGKAERQIDTRTKCQIICSFILNHQGKHLTCSHRNYKTKNWILIKSCVFRNPNQKTSLFWHSNGKLLIWAINCNNNNINSNINSNINKRQ